MWKIISIVAFALVIGIGIRWAVDGAQVFTKDKQQVVVRDELFGTETIAWEDGFWLGLDIAAPVALVLLGVGAFGFCRTRKLGKHEPRKEAL